MHRLGAFMLLAATLLTAAACKTTPPAAAAPADEGDSAALEGDQPALLVEPTAETRAELERVVSDMLFGAEVTLADDALTKTSVLIIERKKIQGLDRAPLSGRDLGAPERFRLYTTGTQCILVHESDHSRYQLLDVECVPEDPPEQTGDD